MAAPRNEDLGLAIPPPPYVPRRSMMGAIFHVAQSFNSTRDVVCTTSGLQWFPGNIVTFKYTPHLCQGRSSFDEIGLNIVKLLSFGSCHFNADARASVLILYIYFPQSTFLP